MSERTVQHWAQIKRLKELYLFLHPETKNGGDRKSDLQIAKLKSEDRADRFAKVEAEAYRQGRGHHRQSSFSPLVPLDI